MKILYLGDGPIQGPASYLYCSLSHLGHAVTHLEPGKKLSLSLLGRGHFDAVILSDYAHKNLKASESLIVSLVREKGMGLLMVGGWGSFSGGGYRGTKIGSLLPVQIQKGDDRLNYSPGLRVFPTGNCVPLKKSLFRQGPVICGLNRVTPKKETCTLFKAHPLEFLANGKVRSSRSGYPLLVVGSAEKGHSAAFTTDFAPHWAGGLVDWGSKRVAIRIPRKKAGIEVGVTYVRFIGQLIRWLTSSSARPGS